MMKIFWTFIAVLSMAYAKLNIVTSYPYIAALTKEIAGEKAEVRSLAKGYFDPHFIVPKPSHIGKVKQADILFYNGAELEIGWLGPLIERAYNDRLKRIDLSQSINMMEKPANISRAHGDIHAQGNPHYHLDPNNILILAQTILRVLQESDPEDASFFQDHYDSFKNYWMNKLAQWKRSMAPLKGKKVISYHKLFSYFYRAYGIKSIAEIEPFPGITPSAAHLIKLIRLSRQNGVQTVVTDVYHSKKAPQSLAKQSHSRLIVLPHDVGAMEDIRSLEMLFDTMIGLMRHD